MNLICSWNFFEGSTEERKKKQQTIRLVTPTWHFFFSKNISTCTRKPINSMVEANIFMCLNKLPKTENMYQKVLLQDKQNTKSHFLDRKWISESKAIQIIRNKTNRKEKKTDEIFANYNSSELCQFFLSFFCCCWNPRMKIKTVCRN